MPTNMSTTVWNEPNSKQKVCHLILFQLGRDNFYHRDSTYIAWQSLVGIGLIKYQDEKQKSWNSDCKIKVNL